MSIFIQTMTKAITDYRQILRRYLSSQERILKVKQLRLKDPAIFKSDVLLFKTAQSIIDDIENNVKVPNEGYYSYHGITKFCAYLKQYLSNYEQSGQGIVHKAQKAANAMIKVIQVFSLPDDQLSDEVIVELKEFATVIASCGSVEQRQLFRNSLVRQCEYAPGFYGDILQYYDEEMTAYHSYHSYHSKTE
jgi:hypothetical protein